MRESYKTQGLLRVVMLAALIVGTGCTTDPEDGEGDGGARDAAARDAAGGAGGVGGTDAALGTGGAGGFVPGDFGPSSCTLPLPDPGDDACLACALENCCGPNSGECIAPLVPARGGPEDCYQVHFIGCIQPCFTDDEDAGLEDSLERVDRCVTECLEQLGGSRVGPLVGCVLGTPVGVEANVDDGGSREVDGPCAESCFPGWH